MEGPRYQPSRSRPASCKSQRLWKLGKSFVTFRRAPGEDPTRRAEPEEYEKSIDTHYKSSIASDSPRGKARWLSRYRSHSTRDRYDGPNSPPEKQGMTTVDAQIGVSGSNCCIELQRWLQPVMVCLHRPLKRRVFPHSYSRSVWFCRPQVMFLSEGVQKR